MANKSILEYEITSPSNTSTVLGEKDGKVKRFNVSEFGGNGSSSGGGASIIDITEEPTNPDTSVIYRTTVIKKLEMYAQDDDGTVRLIENTIFEIVDTLPETGIGAISLTTGDEHYYYQLSDGKIYGYANAGLSSYAGIPEGWYPIELIYGQFMNSSLTMIYSISDITSTGYYILPTTKYRLYYYIQNGDTIEKKSIITSDNFEFDEETGTLVLEL
jgi:hypothetical protein